MNRVEKNKLTLATVIWLIYTILFISIFFSLRAVTSISVGFLLVAGIVKQKGRIIAIIRNSASRFILAGGLVFLVMQLISLVYTDNIPGTWNDITRKIGLTVIPLAVILSGPFDSSQRKEISLSYCVCLLAACRIDHGVLAPALFRKPSAQ